jgi:hypothetical protein
MTTEQRLEKLESALASAYRLNRWLALGAVIILAGALVLVWVSWPMSAQAQPVGAAPKVIRANLFVVEDENGRECITIGRGRPGQAGAGPGLMLMDEKGKVRIALGCKKGELGGPFLSLNDENEKLRFSAQVTQIGGAQLSLADDNGFPRAGMQVMKAGPALMLNDDKGKASVGIVVPKSKPGILVNDETGKIIWSAP